MATGIVLTQSATVTPNSDQTGSTVKICNPDWFDKRASYSAPNPSRPASDLTFSGDDLNFLARVIYAEASGSASVKDESVRLKEKLAIIHVMYNRLNVVGFDPNNWVQGKFTTFRGVASAVKVLPDQRRSGVQFESVIGTDGTGTSKFKSTESRAYELLSKTNCTDFDECFYAIRRFLSTGPQSDLDFDNFRAAGRAKCPPHQQVIGGNRFWKMK